MYPRKKQVTHNRIKSDHYNRLQEPVKVELERRHLNPELFNHKYKYMPTQPATSRLEDFVRNTHHDPFYNKTDYFKYEQVKSRSNLYDEGKVEGKKGNVNKTTGNVKTQESMAKSNSGTVSHDKSTEKHMAKSFSSFKIRENYTYIEQVLSDLAEKTDLAATRRYVNRLEGDIAVKCDKIISRLDNGYLSACRSNNKYSEGLMRLVKLCYPNDNVQMQSKEQMMRDIQKAIVGLREKIKVNVQDDYKKKAKELKEEMTRNNKKLEKESQELQASFQQEKSKMKEHYEQIYVKLYEENRKLRKNIDTKQSKRNQQKYQQKQFHNKHENLLRDISTQLSALKHECRQLEQENARQKIVTSKLKEMIAEKDDFIFDMRQEMEEMEKELDYVKEQMQRSGGKSQRSQQQIANLSGELQNLRNDLSMQKTLNNLLLEKLETLNRKGSNKTLLFQLSQPSLDHKDVEKPNLDVERERMRHELEEVRNELESQKQELKRVVEEQEEARDQLDLMSTKKSRLDQEINDKMAKLSAIETALNQKSRELETIRASLIEEEVQLASISQQEQQKQNNLLQLELQVQQNQQKINETKEELNVLQGRKGEMEGEIANIVLLLVRLESDQMMSKEQMGQVQWVKKWMQWVDENHPFD